MREEQHMHNERAWNIKHAPPYKNGPLVSRGKMASPFVHDPIFPQY